MHVFLGLRFIKNNLLVEVTSDKTLARLFYWALKHHSLISYSLYMAGEGQGQGEMAGHTGEWAFGIMHTGPLAAEANEAEWLGGTVYVFS